MQKILVTGATGFIGQYVIAELLSQGHSVIASSSNAEKAATQPWASKVEYRPLDFTLLDDAVDYFDYFGKPDRVIHLAWEGLPNYKQDFHLLTNFPRHLSFLTNLVRNGLKDLTVTGTCFEYGMQEGCLREDMPVYPANPYAVAKNELRKELEEFCAVQQVHFKWVRLFYIYGEGQNPNSLFSQLNRAIDDGAGEFNMSGGEQVRDFLPIEKVAENLTAIALQNAVEGVINCCSGIPVTVKQFVEDYLKVSKKYIKLNLGYYPYADYEPMRFWGDDTKLKSILYHE